MKKLIFLISICAISLSSCSVNTSDNIDVNGRDIKYVKDTRTGLCYGVVASRKSMSFSTTGLGLTCVPCEKVEHLIDN